MESIKINLISNLIWELILSIPSSLTIAKYLLKQFLNIFSKYNINNNIALVMFFILIEGILIYIIVLINKYINSKTNIPTTETNSSEESNLLEEIEEDVINLDYYFKNYTKHVTIYENGNGIIMNTFDICINNVENFKEFKRKINVEDGKKDLAFPTLSNMKDTSRERRFQDYGFWIYKPKDSIINSTIEKYWSDNDPDEIDHISKNNPKELRWVFEINRSKVKEKAIHKISYAISIPGLYPLEKGKFNSSIANEPEKNGKAASSIHVEHYIKEITYIISFATGINLKSEPECFTMNGTKVPITDLRIEEGVFYNKYIFKINKPSYGTNIVIKWEYYGGTNMDKEGGD